MSSIRTSGARLRRRRGSHTVSFMNKARARNAVVVSIVVLAAMATAACKKPPVPGAECKTKGEIGCVDKKNGVICIDKKWESITCEGATGCMMTAGSGSCTHTNYAVGEPCLKEGEPQCAGDKKAMIKCEDSHWKLLNKCTGKLGCVANANGAKCDLGAAEANSDCTAQNEGNASCTPDGKDLLLCKSGKMTVAAHCRGMHKCRQLGKKIECDETIGQLGDPCDSDGKLACSEDKKTRLSCKGGTFVKDKDCKCSVMIDKVNCN